ncbi:MAG TPA: hypothetical protein VJ810_41225 [Blastocatellia bacterium]|nr:hypothetical protein [Blastocatellia bacterium]
MTDDKPTLDQVTRDALQLSSTDLERLIGRLTAEQERRIINRELREGRELSWQMAASLSATRGVDRWIMPKEKK